MRPLGLALLFACAAPSRYPLPAVVADKAVREELDVRTYFVSGDPYRVVSHVAKMADGLTSWEVQYDFSLVEGGGVCRLRGPHVTLAVQQSYPVAAAQDPYRAAVLDSYLRPLVEHEQGHLRIDRAAAHMLAEALRAVSPQPACDAVREEAWRVAALALENCKASNAAFDAATAHGLR